VSVYIIPVVYGMIGVARTGSVYFTMSVTLERYFAIVRPLSQFRYVSMPTSGMPTSGMPTSERPTSERPTSERPTVEISLHDNGDLCHTHTP
jgi:hypothetical protein